MNRTRLAGALAGVVVVVGLVAGVPLLRGSDDGPSAADTTAPARPEGDAPIALDRPVLSDAEFQDQVGVRIQTLATTGGGGLLDLRYQVLDPSKAGSVHDEATPPTLVDEATGLIVNQLLMGHSHTGDFQAGVGYYLVFENPGNLIQPGSSVTVLLGDAQLEHVVVE